MWNNDLQYIFYLLIFAGLILLWLNQARARVEANRVAMHLCRQQNVQFLDGTVIFQKLRPKRDEQGHMRMQRYYAFDYLPEVSETFEDSRKTGFIVLHGTRVIAVGLASDRVQ